MLTLVIWLVIAFVALTFFFAWPFQTIIIGFFLLSLEQFFFGDRIAALMGLSMAGALVLIGMIYYRLFTAAAHHLYRWAKREVPHITDGDVKW